MTGVRSLVLDGDPFERGRRHGEAFAEEIADNVASYLEYFEQYGVAEDVAREQAAEFVPLIEDANGAYFEEMRGVAEGSGVPLAEVSIVNVRHTIIYSAFSAEIAAEDDPVDASTLDGCTSFGVQPERSRTGHTYLGQNWDWIPPVEMFVMDVRREEGPNFVALTEAGMVGGKFGVNQHGIGYVVNGLTTDRDGTDPFRKPSHVRGREILDAERLDEAIAPIIDEARPCSRNYVVGHASGEIVDIETGPDDVSYLYPEEGLLTHANHFQDRATFDSEFEQLVPNTVCRGMRIRRLLGGYDPVGEDDMKTVLRDHFDRPNSICQHTDPGADDPSHTKASIILDLEERRMLATDGRPCENEYHAHPVATGS